MRVSVRVSTVRLRRVGAAVFCLSLLLVIGACNRTGSIEVRSLPTGAAVWLDGDSTGQQTNCVLVEVPAGAHAVRLAKTGYEDWEAEVTVLAGKTDTISADLIALTGSVQVNSTPTGATVLLDSQNTGHTTNCLLTDVPVGSHELALVLADHRPWQQTITVASGETTAVNANLLAETGSLQVNSTPTGAAITLDSRSTGHTTDFLLTEVPVGSHELTLTLAGYEPWQRTVTVASEETTTVNATLARQTGSLQVNSIPSGAEIWLDDQNTGTVTDRLLTGIATGSHSVKLVMVGYYDWQQTADVVAGQTTTLNAVLVRRVTPPTHLAIAAGADGTSVVLSWDAQTGVDGYHIYLNGARIATTSANTYTHTSPVTTGDYYVTAYKGSDESAGSSPVSDRPVISDNVALYELNAAGFSGLEFSRTTGEASTRTMGPGADITGIDVYFTDFARGYSTLPYCIASPHLVLTQDPGMVWILTGTASTTDYTSPLSTSFDATVTVPSSGYDASREAAAGANYAVSFQGGYYGMIEVTSISVPSGRVDVRAAFQLVPGLRLVAH